jgi:hypothetical protein
LRHPNDDKNAEPYVREKKIERLVWTIRCTNFCFVVWHYSKHRVFLSALQRSLLLWFGWNAYVWTESGEAYSWSLCAFNQ